VYQRIQKDGMLNATFYLSSSSYFPRHAGVLSFTALALSNMIATARNLAKAVSAPAKRNEIIVTVGPLAYRNKPLSEVFQMLKTGYGNVKLPDEVKSIEMKYYPKNCGTYSR
jgi:hypothetical protein